jgi:SAM-dependent methyltransferase
VHDDVSDIAAFYSSDPEKEHVRLEHHQLEHDLTWRYLDRYLSSRGSILGIGAVTGRYTLELAKRGYQLTAVDLSATLIEACRKRTVITFSTLDGAMQARGGPGEDPTGGIELGGWSLTHAVGLSRLKGQDSADLPVTLIVHFRS